MNENNFVVGGLGLAHDAITQQHAHESVEYIGVSLLFLPYPNMGCNIPR